jgi:hypothetical protein
MKVLTQKIKVFFNKYKTLITISLRKTAIINVDFRKYLILKKG